MTQYKNNQIVSILIKLLNEQLTTNLDFYISQSIRYWDPLAGEVRGMPAVQKKIHSFWMKYPNFNSKIDVIVGDENTVVAELSYRGFDNDTGAPLKFSTIVCNFEQNKVVNIKNYFNPQS